MTILVGEFNAKLGREDIFKSTTLNESVHQDSNENGIRVVNFATSKNLVVKSTIFHTKTFINTPVRLLVGRLTTRMLTY